MPVRGSVRAPLKHSQLPSESHSGRAWRCRRAAPCAHSPNYSQLPSESRRTGLAAPARGCAGAQLLAAGVPAALGVHSSRRCAHWRPTAVCRDALGGAHVRGLCVPRGARIRGSRPVDPYPARRPLTPPPTPALAAAAAGAECVTGSSDKRVRVWDLGQRQCTQTIKDHTDQARALSLSLCVALPLSLSLCLSLSLSLSLPLSLSPSLARLLPLSRSLSLPSPSRALSRSLSLTHALSHVRSLTHACSLSPALSLPPSLPSLLALSRSLCPPPSPSRSLAR